MIMTVQRLESYDGVKYGILTICRCLREHSLAKYLSRMRVSKAKNALSPAWTAYLLNVWDLTGPRNPV